MSNQYDLFGNPISDTTKKKTVENTETKAESFELVLSESTSKKDSKNKVSIEKKLIKIDKLKVQIKKIHQDSELIKKLHKEHVHKKELDFYKLKEAYAVKLYKRINEKGFAVWQKEVMEHMILETCSFLSENLFHSETLQEIQKKMYEQHISNMGEMEKEMANEMFEGFFSEMGMDVDMDDFDFTKFTQEQFQEQFNAKFHEKQHEQKAEFKHQEKTEKTQFTDKSFKKIYKALLKKAHPDLVIDEGEKIKREEWTKKLSGAWEARNYYQLLILQKEIDINAEIDISLESTQLKSLIQQLNEEISQLEFEKWRLKNEENEFYYTNFYARSEKGILKKLKEYQNHLEFQKQNTQIEIDNLKTKVSTKKYLKDTLEATIENPFGFLDDFDFN